MKISINGSIERVAFGLQQTARETSLKRSLSDVDKPSERKKPTKKLRKRVAFTETTASNASSDVLDVEMLWYSKKEIQDMATVVDVANSAVNDTCGDLDVSNTALKHTKAILKAYKQQSCDIAEISMASSKASCALAQLHALILQEDVRSNHETGPVSLDMLWKIIQSIDIPENDYDMSSIDDSSEKNVEGGQIEEDASSIGTIDHEWIGKEADKLHPMISHNDGIQLFDLEADIDMSASQAKKPLSSLDCNCSNQCKEKLNSGLNCDADSDFLKTMIECAIENCKDSHCDNIICSTRTMTGNKKSLQMTGDKGIKPSTEDVNISTRMTTSSRGKLSEFSYVQNHTHQPQDYNMENLEPITEEQRNIVSSTSKSILDRRTKRAHMESSSQKNNIDNSDAKGMDHRFEVTNALILLARWEFRSCTLPLK